MPSISSGLIPERARERILDIAATQLETGGAYHQYQPLTKRGNNDVGGRLVERGLRVVRRLVGSYITSLDMAGCSVTLLKMDKELLRLWDAPVFTPASLRTSLSRGPLHSALPTAPRAHCIPGSLGMKNARPLPVHSSVAGTVCCGSFCRSASVICDWFETMPLMVSR